MMLKNGFAFLILLVVSISNLRGQENSFLMSDTTIFLEDIVFNSDIEKNIFKDVYNDESDDYLSLIFLVKKGVDPSRISDMKKEVFNKIENLNSRKIKLRDERKAVKIIYKEIHSEFLKKYELNNHFDDIFSKGFYNCLSASFLYGYILNELKIPYQINLMPNHVNLTTYPRTHKIIIETTDPIRGYFAYNKKFKELYVANLLSYKLIEKQERDEKSVDVLFDEYYNSNQKVSLKELIGSQYYNDGLYLIEEGKKEEAIQQLEKALALYPSINSAHILMSLYSEELKNADYSNKMHIEYLFRLLRYDEMGVDQNNVLFELNNLRRHYLSEKKDTSFYKGIYERLDSSLVSDSVKVKVRKYYLTSLGNFHYKDLRYELANAYYLRTIQLGNVTAKVEDYYIRSLMLHVEDFADKKKALDYLTKGETAFPKMKGSRLYMSYKADILTWLLMINFERNKGGEGEKYRGELEKILEGEDINVNENNIGIAYAQAGVYYFRKGNRTKARQMFNQGLKYSPGNYELTSRLKMLNY